MRWITACALVTACLPSIALGQDARLERNKAVARRAFTEILSQGHYDLAGELYAQDFVNHAQARDVDLKGDQEALRGWRDMAPDIVIAVDQLVAEGDLVTVLWTARGTNTRAGRGLPATGKTIQLRGITIWRIVDGRIREEWSAMDRLWLLQQAGVLPADLLKLPL